MINWSFVFTYAFALALLTLATYWFGTGAFMGYWAGLIVALAISSYQRKRKTHWMDGWAGK